MSESQRWSAVVARDPAFDGKFVYCVKTTKIFCRPICKARLARRANVEFRDTPAQAEAAGYRACKRCQPLLASYNPEAEKVKRVCGILDGLPQTAKIPDLEHLAGEVNLTKHHFHRLFKRETGLTPRQYVLSARRPDILSDSTGSTVMTPITPFDHSIGTPVVLDDDFGHPQAIDMSLFDDGKNLSLELETFLVYHSIVETTCGMLLIAFQNREICKLELGMEQQELMDKLETSFPSLYFFHSPIDMANAETALYLQQRVLAMVEALENPGGKLVDPRPALNLSDLAT